MSPPITLAIVDDSSSLQKFLKHYLSTQGFIIICQAYNGQELLSHLESGEVPQMVLLDTNMPVMNGYETALHLHVEYPSIQILVYSFLCDKEKIDAIFKDGLHDFICKEAEPEEIRDALLALHAKSLNPGILNT